jgi:hypothetical protein
MTPNELTAYQALRQGMTQEDCVEAMTQSGMRYADAVLAVASAADADLRAAAEIAAIRRQDQFSEQRGLTRRKLSETRSEGTLITGPPVALAAAQPPTQPSAHLLDDRQRQLKRDAMTAETERLNALGLPFSRPPRSGEWGT